MVAAGLVPFALGNDAGGSVRIPAAICGCSGALESFHRMRPQGPSPTCAESVGQTGALTTCARDAALLHVVMADAGAPPVVAPPLPAAEGAGGLKGLRVGVFWPWFEDCDASVLGACQAALAALEAAGARRPCRRRGLQPDTLACACNRTVVPWARHTTACVPVRAGAETVPVGLPGLEQARAAHAVSVCVEVARGLHEVCSRPGVAAKLAPETTVTLAAARCFTDEEYGKVRPQLEFTNEICPRCALIDTSLSLSASRVLTSEYRSPPSEAQAWHADMQPGPRAGAAHSSPRAPPLRRGDGGRGRDGDAHHGVHRAPARRGGRSVP